MSRRKNIAEILVDMGILTNKDLEEVIAERKALPEDQRDSIKDMLLDKTIVTDKELLQARGKQLGIPYVSLYNQTISGNTMSKITQTFAQSNHVLPIKLQNNILTVAMANPINYEIIENMELSTGFEIQTAIASKDDIVFAINKHYREQATEIEQINVSKEAKVADKSKRTKSKVRGSQSNSSKKSESDDPNVKKKLDEEVVRLFEQILLSGTQLRASDIHIDPEQDYVAVRYRIDGELQQDRKIEKALHSSLTARVKILADLDITQNRIPQDGRFKMDIGDTSVDLRVACLPTIHGEKIVIRILDMSGALRDTGSLGFTKQNLARYRDLIKHPSGLILLTGPTGSGKSSALYASIRELNQENVNTMTIEDPVEIELEGINQIQVNSGAGLTFAAGLRSILRQDPNIIMIGEIRDRETAEIAIRAAMTGHLVFSTLHTNNAIETIPRLIEMGVEPYLVSSALKGVVAQRLVRRLCMDCRFKRKPNVTEDAMFETHGHKSGYVYDAVGCDSCHQTGYRGRFAVHELVVIDDEMNRLLLSGATMTELNAHAVTQDVSFLIDDGIIKVKNGLTSMSEVMRIAADA